MPTNNGRENPTFGVVNAPVSTKNGGEGITPASIAKAALKLSPLLLAACGTTPNAGTAPVAPTETLTPFQPATNTPDAKPTVQNPTAAPAQPTEAAPVKTDPTATVEAVKASPTPSFEQWAQANQPDANTVKFVEAPYLQAMGLKESDVTLKPEMLSGPNGNFAVLVDAKTGTPLFISGENKNWQAVNPKNLANALGFDISVSLGGYGSVNDYDKLVKFQKANFNAGQVYFGSDMWTNDNEANFGAPLSDAGIGKQAGMKDILGMNILWANDIPAWMKGKNFSADQMQQIIKNYLNLTVGAFKGKINSWVVVNEFDFVDNGTDIYKKAMGDQYVDFTFAQARQLDPDATLIYNDGNNETVDGSRYTVTKTIIDRLKAQDSQNGHTPNIGVGLQMHVEWNNVPDMQKVIEGMQSYGVPVYVTEFDVRMDGFQGTPAEKERVQAEIYQKMLTAAVRSGVVKQFNVFGLIDRLSVWEKPGRYGGHVDSDPLILHDDFTPKQSFFGMLSGMMAGAQPQD